MDNHYSFREKKNMLGIFLDTETTGLDPGRHKPIDIAFKIIDMSSGDLKASYQSIIKQSIEDWEGHDPESIEVNGFTWEMVSNGKIPSIIAEEIKEVFKESGIKRGEAFFICQNPAFDRGFFNQLIPVYVQEELNWPYHWLDLASMYWSRIARESGSTPKIIALSKDSIGEAYNLFPEEKPHIAVNGVDHLIACYYKVIGKGS